MVRMNGKMNTNLSVIELGERKLAPALQAIVERGIDFDDGVCILRALKPGGSRVDRGDFPDKTGYECFVNSIHLADYIKDEFLEEALAFVANIFQVWGNFDRSPILNAIVITSDADDAVVKFHIVRSGERWLSSNLDAYEEGVLEIRSNEAGLIETLMRRP